MPVSLYTFFTKATTKKTMSPSKSRQRRDSFGLQLGKDGTVTLDLPGMVPGGMVTKSLESDVRRNGGSSRTTSAAGSNSHSQRKPLRLRKNASSLSKVRQRRDSFGLEVRVDGTLSLDQLGQDRGQFYHTGAGEARSSKNNEINYSGRNSNVHGGEGESRSLRGQSPDRRNNLEESHRSTRIAPQPTTSMTTGNRSRRHPNEDGSITTYESIMPSTQTPRRLDGTQRREVLTGNSEIGMLRERVRMLEAALASQAIQTENSDAPPAYESQPSSPSGHGPPALVTPNN